MVEPRTAYAYDALYRLVRAEGREHAAQNNVQRDAKAFAPDIGIPVSEQPEALQRYREDYEYDAAGNIMAMHHTGGAVQRWVRRYQYALDSNRLLSTRLPADPARLPPYAAAPGYGAKYVHDPHGNMIAMPHLPAMEWDFKDQLQASQQQVANGGRGERPGTSTTRAVNAFAKSLKGRTGRCSRSASILGLEIYRKHALNPQTGAGARVLACDGRQAAGGAGGDADKAAGADPAARQLCVSSWLQSLGICGAGVGRQGFADFDEEYHPYGTTAYQSAPAWWRRRGATGTRAGAG
jgi:hypothetical protein